ncbi:MAG: hypothetical protein JW938_05540 [Candidatus Omnitrophica bacterium]|nr:hypothetical protein [Candidatus Omnitrophota bacterium]
MIKQNVCLDIYIRSCVVVLVLLSLAFSKAWSKNESENEFLVMVQRKAFLYFEECSNKETGLVQDRAHNFKHPKEARQKRYRIASVAATGYYLSAYIVAAENGWVKKEETHERIINCLRFFANEVEHVNGFYYHFMDMDTGVRLWNSELSSIDTALFLAGVLFAKEYYAEDEEVQRFATTLYERVNWQWMTNKTDFLCMGWHPNPKGGGRFLKTYWDHYNESMILYIMAIGSPTYPVPVASWFKINRTIKRYGEHVCIANAPLFVHQYSHIWVDFRNKNDGIADYFENSKVATLANREFCIDNKEKFKTYEENVWGLTACDGPDGYKAYGGKPGHEHHDGTVAPTAAAGSIVFTPELSRQALLTMYEKHGERLWGRYGFSDSFNVGRDWFAQDCIAIDQGTIVLMIENFRSGLLWAYFMKNPWIAEGMERIGFSGGTKIVTMPEPPRLIAYRTREQIVIDGQLDEWDLSKGFSVDDMNMEYGSINDAMDFSGKIYLQYDDANLYVAVRVKDNDIVDEYEAEDIHRDDCLEIFTDPGADGLRWGDPQDVQIGIVPNVKSTDYGVKSWSWFQKTDTKVNGTVVGAWSENDYGYVLEAAISFKALLIEPKGKVHLSISLHDQDDADSSQAKVTTYFEELNGKDGARELGYLIFE